MESFEDYYEVLGVGPDSTDQEIKDAYLYKANILHPDRLGGVSESIRRRAEDDFKKVNRAYDVLKDPKQRNTYHSEWLQRKQGATGSSGVHSGILPTPIVEPAYIKLKNIAPGQVKRISFIVINSGGSYSKISIDNPDSWLRVTTWRSLSSADELPLKVYAEAQGKDWSKTYSGKIGVRLDNVETQVKVDFQTKLLIKDHKWHDVDYDDLKKWVKKRKDRLDAGEELKGKKFRYRLNRRTNKYQVRLRHAYSSAVYTPFH